MITEERPVIHVRLPKGLVKQIDMVAVYLNLDRARATEHLLGLAFECLRDHGGESGLAVLATIEMQPVVCNGHIFADEVAPGSPRCVLPKGHAGFCSAEVQP